MDENYQCLKDEATKTEQALENAKNEFEAHKAKLESIYKAMNKTDDELNSIFSEIESDRKIPGMPLHEDYHKSYWKWKDADEANKNAQTAKDKYNENLNADIPDVMIQLKEVKQQNEELKNELQEVKNEMKQQNEELKNKMQEMTAMLPQMMMQVLRDFEQRQRQERQRQEELERQRQRQRQEESKKFCNNITTNLSGCNQEKDIQFPAPIEARYITFQPKEWTNHPTLRCDVYVDGQLQTTPESCRSASSYLNDSFKTSTLNEARYGWIPAEPYKDGWLKLDLGSRQRITGIRVGSRKDASEYTTKLALSFE